MRSPFTALRQRKVSAARTLLFSSSLLTIATCVSEVAVAQTDRAFAFDIKTQPIRSALLEVSRQAHVRVVIAPDAYGEVKLVSLHGRLPVHVALDLLLKDSGLRYIQLNNAIWITRIPDASLLAVLAPVPGGADFAATLSDSNGGAENDNTSSARQGNADREQGGKVDEVIVTAQKREEHLEDVPVPVSAITAESLVTNNQVRIQDYFSSVPGLTYTTDFRGMPILAIRGLATGTDVVNPTVAIVVDDVPYGSSTGEGGGSAAPDLDPGDLQRIEVLRGPQGTLYGASSLGGLLKFVTLDPSTDRLSGHIQAGTSTVYNAEGAGYNVRGSLNVPLTDTSALLASAFTREDPGYIDNILTGQNSINKTNSYGTRLSYLWKPSDALSVKLGALYQETKSDGSGNADVGPGFGDLQQSYVRGTGWLDRQFQVYSANVHAKLGNIDLTSITGYSVNRIKEDIDYTAIFGGFTQFGIPGTGFNGFGVPGTPVIDNNRTNKFSEEIRLTASASRYLDWLFGFFYTHERSPESQNLLAADPPTGTIVGTWFFNQWAVTYAEYSGFADFTVHLTDTFDVQLGARESHIDQTYGEVDTGVFVPLLEGFPSPLVFPEVDTHASAFTYLVTPRFKITPDFMLYARIASGYRPGGPNPTATPYGLPDRFSPDTTKNYEVGFKGDVLDHALSFDASVYYIDWKDIQLEYVASNGFAYYANGSAAKSEGVELSLEAHPVKTLKLTASMAWNNAKLTEDLPAGSALYGFSGDRLPYGARFTGNLGVQDDVALTDRITGFVGGMLSYVGNREGVFASVSSGSTARQEFPSYARTDLNAGIHIGEPWTVSAFVNNATDRRVPLSGGLGTVPDQQAFTFLQPRTVGVQLRYDF